MELVTLVFIFALAIVAWAPDTPLGKALHNCLVEAPVRIVENMTPKKIVIGAIVLVCLIGFAMSAPELVALIGFGDLAVYMDAAVIAMLLTAAARLKFVLTQVMRFSRTVAARLAIRTNGNGARKRGSRRHRPKLPRPSDDAEPHAGWAFA
jgi:hypothetical protein